MKINDELLDKLARLARINIPESDKEKMKAELSEIVTWMEKLSELDTDDVEPLTNMSEEVNRWREDSPQPHLDREIALKNAPSHESGYFKVPNVLKSK
ncbi:MAG: Asp-tRNA(Asn)/Glu-tRNA(Gln) amidotransferase subunit GatC [Bacteroidetes bacterium]|nr:Asp-tRNA(Asn)/Glu-tRNA(Gln) amidotransferase subunit GatC [Bacteroidota bacterium]